jgi:predicted ArsR family transcriptional regulator
LESLVVDVDIDCKTHWENAVCNGREKWWRRQLRSAVRDLPNEAAAQVGISRSLAAYHLDKLVATGLLDTRFERRTGRTGPGAGRTAKLYQRSASAVDVPLPARDYGLIAEILARAIEADGSGRADAALDRSARSLGAEVGG